jgi:ApbE superfamily uncharacterized protein (UPF0280 family)
VAWQPGLTARSLPDGRLAIEEGPIHLVVGMEGGPAAIRAAQQAVVQRMTGLLAGLCRELPLLRAPLSDAMPALRHPVARRMAEACWPHRVDFITPMACVAGAIAEHALAAITEVPGISVAHVNNGGDIALHLAPRRHLRVGLCADLTDGRPDGMALIRAEDGIGGIATSGWPGRSFSRGIADAVTVLAARAAEADAAATIIANAVDADHPAVLRKPANMLDADSDLGDTPVTVAVRNLPPPLVLLALERGARVAERLLSRGVIRAALLRLKGQSLAVGDIPVIPLSLDNPTPALR